MRWWVEFLGRRKYKRVVSRLCGVVLLILALCFITNSVLFAAKPVDWPKPMADCQYVDPGSIDPKWKSGSPQNSSGSTTICPENGEVTAVHPGLSQKKETVMEEKNRAFSLPWMFWSDLLMILFN